MPDLVQHLIVTVVALLAAWVLVRRVSGVFAPTRASGTGCTSCGSNRTDTAPRDQGR